MTNAKLFLLAMLICFAQVLPAAENIMLGSIYAIIALIEAWRKQ